MPKLQDLNPFAEKEVPLEGKRISVIQQENITSDLAAANRPIVLPQPQANDAWSQPGGTATNAPGHLALNGSVKSTWSASIGTGSSFYGKLTASPIVYDGRVYTLDAAGKVTALSASGGAVVWKASTTPPNEKDQEGFGGGLAADGGRIYAATGFGLVVALDAKGGKKLWEKNLGSPLRASPTAAGERVFVVTKEGQVFCLSGSDGTRAVELPGPVRACQHSGQHQPCRRRRHGGRALSDRRCRGAPRIDRPADLVGIAGADAHGLIAERHERRGAAGHQPVASSTRWATPVA